MSSSVFTEAPSARPAAADGDSNLVVVYSKNGVSFDERAIGNIMEEKSISTISVVRLTSPTPSMVDQEEAERLEELESFLEAATDSELDSDNGSQSGGDDASDASAQDEENQNTGEENNGDSTETETDAPRTRRRAGRKPKAIKKRKRRRPKERPQIVGLRVEQFYADGTADMVVKNALKLAGVSVYKRTAETDALMEVIRNDHNYTPFTSPEELKNHKRAEKMAMEMQAQSRKIIMQAPGSVKLINAKKRVQTIPFSPLQVKVQRLPVKPTPVQQPTHLQPKVQLIRKTIQQPLPRPKPEIIASPVVNVRPRPTRAPVKVIAPVQDYIEDDDDAQSSDPADEENADKSYDTEEMSEESDDFQESDNDRDSDMDFNMRRSGGRNPNKRKRVRKVIRPVQTKPAKPLPLPPSTPQHFPELKKRKEVVEQKAPQIGQIIQLPPKAPPSVIALGRGLASTSFLKIRPTHQTLPVKKPPLPATNANTKVRRMPVVHMGRIINSATPGVFTTPPQEGVKEIIINKNMASPKGVFTNLNSLLGENNNATIKSSPDPLRHRAVMSPSTPRSSYSQQLAPIVVPVPAQAQAPNPSKGFMPIGVDTAQSHKLPSQIVIETHQSSSELAAENDKQLDLINSIVQDELLNTTLVEQPTVNAVEDIPKLVKMLESTAAGLDQASVSLTTPSFATSEIQGVNNAAVVDPIDITDEDEITADFLQHVVGLIEEDKQFEAEVVKQVLASAEPGALDSIVSLPTPAQPVILPQAPIAQQQVNLPSQAVLVEAAMPSLPIACSTPSRSVVNPLPTSAKVVRGNGRVIYLPPIEAPTTRAKRRAQFPPAPGMATDGTGDLSNLSFGDTSMDTSINQLANSSSLSNDSQSGVGPKRPNPREPSMARRSTVPRRSKKPNTSQSNDPDASESQEDDDDPNKLWCICRQPHNNRFMICCDLCEDWFHGTCVGVTKAMGTEMEQKGVDWKCPKCVKKQEEKSQPRITEMLVTRTTAEAEEKPKETKVLTLSAEFVQVTTPRRTLPVGVTVASSPIRVPMMKPVKKFPAGTVTHQQQQLNFIKLGASPANRISESICVVCKRPTSPHSVYCGEECIRKYAQSALQAHTATKAPESPLPHNASTQSPLNNSLEAKKNKKKDLFEDVLRQADSVSKVERINVFERRSGRVITGHLAPTAHQFRKWLQENPTFEVLPSGTLHSADAEKRQLKRAPEVSSVDESGTPAVQKKPLEAAAKLSQPITVQVNTLGISSVRPLAKKVIDKEKEKQPAQVATPVRSDGRPEPVRIGIRRSLREQLLARIKEAQAEEQTANQTTTQWLTSFEVDQFVKSVELEMFNSFGRDVGAKYKAKYRSLMFNIKDRKNRTLFEKICAKQVEPKQLVRMTPEQLASQELAKWREEENRHQLDMIKKSELDMLSCAQNYVVKTHKGEEVIATKVDVTLPEEDINAPATVDRKQTSLVSEPDTSALERSISRDKSATSKDKRHKSHKHHHRKRSRSRSNSRGRTVDKRHRRHHNEGESGAGSGGGDREREHRSREKQSREKDEAVPSPTPKKRDENDVSPVPKKIPEKKAEASAYNLIDQILESEKTVEQAANLGQPKPSPKPLPTLPSSSKPPEPMDNYSRYVQGQATSPLWSGPLKMIDVTEFDVSMHPVQGNCHQMGKLMPSQLDVIGRITRVNVWEYIKKLKKSPTKEVVIVNIFPASPNDTFKFDLFFDYLDSRQRLGVMGVDSDQIRDFYIFPLGTGDALPAALQTTERVPFYEDAQRPNTLLGIIVRCLSKRPPEAQSTPPSVPSPVPAASSKAAKKSRNTTLFTPQISPKRKASTHSTSSKDDEFDIDAIIKAPIAKLQKTVPKPVPLPPANNDADDEPYSPGGSDDELVPVDPRVPNDLERQVNEINKQIAAQQMEIAGLLKVEPTGSASSSNVLAGISIPPNLSKILASIKDKADLSAHAGDGASEYNPEDAITTTSAFAAKPKSKGRLAHLSEAELLSMVPDNLAGVIPSSSMTRHQQAPPPPLPPPPPPPGV
ncbi:death-inducer obliterator 1 isoform X1 [Drosophila gunungcola]|uniref:Death-inducer obliterator 1 n=1 Tax=Drosophila gunungcola TaxID=103775 RepID=A0A9P9Z171_9MUSC|nr:death-inducer obliterator 1 isoform X1 [Drosophila gunungcola]KAI8046839.1 hypothetical protein M5D96_003053 [Drosophila gunungcola]